VGRRFRFRLALALHCTVRELEQRLDHAELVEWMAYDAAIEPFGDKRADLRAAVVAAASQAPHVKGNVEMAGFLLFPEDRFDVDDDQEAAIDRLLDRAAARAACADAE
jgi:hypothetical protein